MTNRAQIETVLRSAYKSRVRGDVDGVLGYFSHDAQFVINGRGAGVSGMHEPCCGVAAIRPLLAGLIGAFRFTEWQEISLLVDGNTASLHWRARVTHTATGKSDMFDVVDLVTFCDAQISHFHEFLDTALAASLGAPSASVHNSAAP